MRKLSNSLSEKIERADLYINNLLGAGDVYEAMKYSLVSGGKRIRPLLCMLACEAMGTNDKQCMPFAAAIEMVHTYSLIHDDLPAMDNDDLRRGRPTSHKIYGEAMAILAGDALLTEAFRVVAAAPLEDSKKVLAAERLALCAGASGMVLGQALDMGGTKTLEDLFEMYRRKTGALFAAALGMGAIAAGGRGDEFDTFAYFLGIAFQIEDDILDVTQSDKKTGKTANSDEKNDKKTTLAFLDLDKARETLKDYTKRAIDSIAFTGDRGKPLCELAMYLTQRDY